MQARYDLASVGNFTRDTIVTAAGTRFVNGGGFNYAAFAARATGLSVVAVTRLAREHDEVVRELAAVGIDALVEYTDSSTLMRLEYPTADVDQRILTVAATAGSITPAQVAGVAADAFVVSPSIRGEVGADVIEELRRPGVLVGLDVQGMLRIRHENGLLEHSPWPDAAAILPLVDVLKTDAVEAASLTGETDHLRAARAIAALGTREVVLTHRGGLLVLADGEVHEAQFVPTAVVGRSGRGDTCLGSYLAWRLRHSPAEACRWAVAATSLKLEAEGPLRRSYAEIEALYARLGGEVALVAG
jgi:sugar/nucleoside kinase (ribokinase family)